MIRTKYFFELIFSSVNKLTNTQKKIKKIFWNKKLKNKKYFSDHKNFLNKISLTNCNQFV